MATGRSGSSGQSKSKSQQKDSLTKLTSAFKSQPTAKPAAVTSETARKSPAGRKADGKRSDPAYISRSFLVQRTTDTRLKQALLDLEAQGIYTDKSEVVDAILDAWLHWLDGGDADAAFEAISPRRRKLR